MPVYVDTPRWHAHDRVWCHMVADTSQELDEIALRLGLKPEWKQHAGSPREHFDLPPEGRERAIQLGAVPVPSREIARIIRERRLALLSEPMGR